MSFALTYFAEHYVIDLIAGGLLAAVVMVGCSVWESWRAQRAQVPSTEVRDDDKALDLRP